MRTTLNGLRATIGLPANLATPGSFDAGVDMLFSERASGCMPPATAWATCGG
jgi:hypothetical protein